MINVNSELAQRYWEKGRLEDCPILDMHAHMFNHIGGYMPAGSTKKMLEHMDDCNTILTCFVSHAALQGVDKYKDIEVAARYPERLKNYRIVLSTHLDVDKDIRMIDENRDLHVGFKFLCDYYSVPLSDERHKPYFEYADENKLLVLSHTWGRSIFNGPEQAEKVLEKYHNLTFVAGHSFFGEFDKAVELAKRYPNLYLEFTAVHQYRGAFDYIVQKMGSEKLLFGMDLPWFSYLHGIGAILSAEMTDNDRRNIFYRNGRNLLSRFGWFAPIWEKYAPGIQ